MHYIFCMSFVSIVSVLISSVLDSVACNGRCMHCSILLFVSLPVYFLSVLGVLFFVILAFGGFGGEAGSGNGVG